MKKILVFLITIFTFISCYSQDVTIEDFTTGTTLNSADYLPYWQSGVTKKISITNFNTWLNGTTRTIGGTWTFSNTITGAITGNAGTVTNGVYTTGSYSNPSWLSNLGLSKIDVSAEDPADVLMVSSLGTLVAYPFSGDATINDIGVVTISNNAVGSAEVTNESLTSSDIDDETITNSDISTTASISLTKLQAPATSGQIILSDDVSEANWVTITGDLTIDGDGVADISGTITDNIIWTGSHSYTPESFAPSGTTTLSASGVRIMFCQLDANSATITDFTSAVDGQEIILINSHTSTFAMAIDHGSEIYLSSLADETIDPGETMYLAYVSSVDMWYEVGH